MEVNKIVGYLSNSQDIKTEINTCHNQDLDIYLDVLL